MSITTKTSCRLHPRLQPLTYPYISTPRSLSIAYSSAASDTSTSLHTTKPVHWLLICSLWHLHVSPHHEACPLLTHLQPLSPPRHSTPRSLSIGYSSAASVTSMSLHTTKPVHWLLICSLCHLHVSPHHEACPLVTHLQPLSPPCLYTPRSLPIGYSSAASVTSTSLHTTKPVHWLLICSLCHLHVSPHYIRHSQCLWSSPI